LKGSLDANVVLYAAPALKMALDSLGEELRFVLITSEASVLPLEEAPENAVQGEDEELRVVVLAAEEEKCERCWHRRPDVGSATNHPALCHRCVVNVDGEGEVRHYA
jgi:isoleucyl-tRNA synthetase